MNWIREKPTVVGMYLFKLDREWKVLVRHVHWGAWRSAQNPDWLYADSDAIPELEGQWYGPILEPSK